MCGTFGQKQQKAGAAHAQKRARNEIGKMGVRLRQRSGAEESQISPFRGVARHASPAGCRACRTVDLQQRQQIAHVESEPPSRRPQSASVSARVRGCVPCRATVHAAPRDAESLRTTRITSMPLKLSGPFSSKRIGIPWIAFSWVPPRGSIAVAGTRVPRRQ